MMRGEEHRKGTHYCLGKFCKFCPVTLPLGLLLASTLSKPPSLQLTGLLPPSQGRSAPCTQGFKVPK